MDKTEKKVRKKKKPLPKKAQKDVPTKPKIKKVNAWWVVDEKTEEKTEKEEDTPANVSIKLVTKQSQYAVPQNSIAISENANSDELNKLVASILERTGNVESIPVFQFMVEGKLVITTLGQTLKSLNISTEALVKVEFFERFPPPSPLDKLEHDDWVSSVMCCKDWLVSACYDNTVQLWSVDKMIKARGKDAHKLTIPAHKGPVKDVAWINTKERVKSFVSCSIDQTAIVWEWDSVNNSVECVWECRGHTQSIECLSVEHFDQKFATGSWDNSIKIWDCGPQSTDNCEEEFSGERDTKRLKKSKKERLRTPIMTLVGHGENVSCLDWMETNTLLSCSWDHSIRLWDVEIGKMSSQINGNMAFFSVSYSKKNQLFLASVSDRVIRLYDPRSNGVVLDKYAGHRKWVPSLHWCPNNEHLFVSGGFDSVVRVWDKRSSKASLYTLKGHDDQVFSVDWTNPQYIASGSADCTAQIYVV